MAMEKVYIRFKGRVLGPVTLEKAIEMVNRGQITRQHEVSADGMSWQAAGNVPELFANRTDRRALGSQLEPAANNPEPPAGNWYANFDFNNQGPTDEVGIRQWIAMGKVTRSTLIWREGMDNWVEAGVAQPSWFVGIPMEQPYQVNLSTQQNSQRASNSQNAGDNGEASPVSDGLKIGIAILSFLVPLVGLIMGLIYLNDSHPDKKAAGKLWLTCAGVMIGLNVLCCCAYMVLVIAAAGANA
jgi:hypothetical protein